MNATEQPLGYRKERKKGRNEKGEGRGPWGGKCDASLGFPVQGNQPLTSDRPAQSSLGNQLKLPRVCVCQYNKQVDEREKRKKSSN